MDRARSHRRIRWLDGQALRALDDVATIGDEDERRATFEALVQGLNQEPLSS
jgi:hypothetical protein